MVHGAVHSLPAGVPMIGGTCGVTDLCIQTAWTPRREAVSLEVTTRYTRARKLAKERQVVPEDVCDEQVRAPNVQYGIASHNCSY